LNLSTQTDTRDLYKMISRLDNTEMELYKAGQMDTIGFTKWQQRELCRWQASIIITANKNRRKRRESEEESMK
jgi:hypothetical protein